MHLQFPACNKWHYSIIMILHKTHLRQLKLKPDSQKMARSFDERKNVCVFWGKTSQIPCFSKKRNPWTAEPSYVLPERQFFKFFLEQHKQKLIVPKQHKIFSIVESSTKQLFYHLTKSAKWRPGNASFQSSTKLLIFSLGVVILLSYRCHRSPGLSSIMAIPEQHKIKHTICEQHKIQYFKLNL